MQGCQKEGRRELLVLWSKPELTFKLGLWHHFFLAEEVTTRGRREVRGSMAGRGQGEDDTPEGWPFLNFYCFARIELDFCGRKGK